MRTSEDCSSSGGPQQQQQIRIWDMDASDHRLLVSVTVAATAAGLRLNQLRVQEAGLGLILSDSLLRYLDVLQVDTTRLSFDREVPMLGRALQRLIEPPKHLNVFQVQHRASMASLELTCAPLLAPRLQRLEFHWCAGLTPANLVSLLVALPMCEEVVVRSCERLHTGRKYTALVEGLLALPQEAELRSRPLHIHLDRDPLGHVGSRPLESEEGTEYVGAEAVAVDEAAEVARATADNASLRCWTYSQWAPSFAGTSEDDKEVQGGEEEEGVEGEGEEEGEEEEEGEVQGEGEEEGEEEQEVEEEMEEEKVEEMEEEGGEEGEGGEEEQEEEVEKEEQEVDEEEVEEEADEEEQDEAPCRQQAAEDAEDIVRRLTGAIMQRVRNDGTAWELNRRLEDGGVAARVSVGTLRKGLLLPAHGHKGVGMALEAV
ncbi:hypothetical protein PLESTB_000975700 [Pleodorina starrii]|uniref:Uncharacterized protein n=1 Tax=Pleodorina starrii TaxID=330485 RepID=A0A9W6BNF6_9CHLO|nr:hypothetical protein PLESTB_000975700 [Pleodorina starrii]